MEGAFAQLEAVIERLETEEISLEDAFRAYRGEVELLQFCDASSGMVEREVLKVNSNGGLNEF